MNKPLSFLKRVIFKNFALLISIQLCRSLIQTRMQAPSLQLYETRDESRDSLDWLVLNTYFSTREVIFSSFTSNLSDVRNLKRSKEREPPLKKN